MRYIFIAFYGSPACKLDQPNATYAISKGFECWDLKKFTFEQFIKKIKKRIPPINNNVLNLYLSGDNDVGYGIDEEQFSNCTWGLLLPEPAEHGNSYSGIASLLNLYSTSFLHPAFYVSDFGIYSHNKKVLGNWLHSQNRSKLFKTKKFVSFYKKMIDTIQYFGWYRDDAIRWENEDWRLFVASNTYKKLEKYETSKSIFEWQEESAEMCTLLETLFTAGDSDKEEIGYRLKKRIFSLIGWKFESIEIEIRDMYSDRSDFVHGSYYKKIIKLMKKNPGDKAMPLSPDFKELYKLKERIRFIFVAYLYSQSKFVNKNTPLTNHKTFQDTLEKAILDIKLRQKVTKISKEIIDLLPESETGYF